MKQLENLKLSPNQFHSEIYTFEYDNRICYLVPMPHKDMKHNFMLEHQYRGIDYKFSWVKKETMINFFGTDEYNQGNRYNVFLPVKCVVVEFNKISGLTFFETPNPNYTYLVGIPL